MDEILNQIEKFHGHLGPYVVIGYKMGEIANQMLGSDPFKKHALVLTGVQPPISCIIDGIQISSGCTLGKGNISVNDEGAAKVQFTDKNGKKIEIALKPKTKHEIDTTVTDNNIIQFSKQIYAKSNEELFDIYEESS
ncbi:MAG: formylmethanofuran dehydrogenase [Candidatus Asgardarchaeum californiense]|nr:MAG: formylmethanofuran dehydrogenase [Candidatus Asgardarchaeum californiense]